MEMTMEERENLIFFIHDFRISNQYFDLGDFEQKKEGTHQKGHGDFSPDWRASHSDNFWQRGGQDHPVSLRLNEQIYCDKLAERDRGEAKTPQGTSREKQRKWLVNAAVSPWRHGPARFDRTPKQQRAHGGYHATQVRGLEHHQRDLYQRACKFSFYSHRYSFLIVWVPF